jgi:hypothetical protein
LWVTVPNGRFHYFLRSNDNQFEVKANIKDAHADEIWAVSWKKNKIITGSGVRGLGFL